MHLRCSGVHSKKERAETTYIRVLIECPRIQHGCTHVAQCLCCSNMHVQLHMCGLCKVSVR